MRGRARTGVTLVSLVVLLAFGWSWGWAQMTKPLPRAAEAPACVMRTVKQGEPVHPDDVVVSVLNAGNRAGLAGRTMQMLVDEGFAAGDRGNAPAGSDVATAQVWTDDPQGPAAELVARWLGPGTEIVERTTAGTTGVVVVVGDAFETLADGPAEVTATTQSEVCSPPL